MLKMCITPEEIKKIQTILNENNIEHPFVLIYDNSSGIGATLDLEFDTKVNGRDATIRIPISGVESW